MQAQTQATPSQAWLLIGHKAGDNTQMRALASALGGPAKEISMDYSAWEPFVTLSSTPSLLTLAPHSRKNFAPPWPDLVLTAGRRNEAVARWISQASGQRSKIVHIGRPWHHPRHFDLVITSPQYQVDSAPNVVSVNLPLHRPPSESPRQGNFDHLPRPRIALLIGGNSGALTLHAQLARKLISESEALAERLAGSLLVSTSARTPACLYPLLAELNVANHVWHWGAPNNPYQDYLGVADAFVVTSDSVSMLAEAVSTTRPVLIFDLAERNWWRHPAHYRPNALLHRAAMRIAPNRFKRDTGRIHRQLVELGRVHWLRANLTELPTPQALAHQDVETACAAVRRLLSD